MTALDQVWLWVDSGAAGAPWNMAVDEALLEAVPRLGRPVLRFYSWTEPAASFGYFQKHAEVSRLTPLRPLVRRPTGGGIVPHDRDWTYSMMFPAGHAWHALKAVESYQRIHEWVQAAFGRLGILTELAGAALKALPGQCFVGHEVFDVLCGGRKIAGAAQRRTRAGLLIQGSVQAGGLGVGRAGWQEAMLAAGRATFGVRWAELDKGAGWLERAEELARTKYSQVVYNEKR